MRKIVMLAMAAGCLSATVTASYAGEATDKAVKARRGFFQAMYFNAGPLFGMLKGKVAYDAETAKKLANNIKLITMMSNEAMWPKGTDSGALKGQTRAKADIWAADSKFSERWADWRKAATQLAEVAGNGQDAFAGAMKAMGGACGACHKPYRDKEF